MKNKKYYILAFMVSIILLVSVFILLASAFIMKRMSQNATIVETTIKQDNSVQKKENLLLKVNMDTSLRIASGFSIVYLVKNLDGPRVLAFDPKGNLVVSLTRAGKIVVTSGEKRGEIQETKTLIADLSSPHGLLFQKMDGKQRLFVAETNRITRFDYDEERLTVSNPQKIVDLPAGGRHFTRTLLWLPDGRILISVGSSCDTCREKDSNRASILVMNPDGTSLRKFATGLRNSVFMRFNEKTKEVWSTEMWRDFLWDDLPPDEINIIKEWNFYGWPYCYGENIVDTSFDKSQKSLDICQKSNPPIIDIPAHSAPLGLAFIPDSWPEKYWGDLLVAYHGSWNRSTPTGYKIVRMMFDSDNNFTGVEDFIIWWRGDWKVRGRPVDLLFDSNWSLLISDDYSGAIYKVIPNPG